MWQQSDKRGDCCCRRKRNQTGKTEEQKRMRGDTGDSQPHMALQPDLTEEARYVAAGCGFSTNIVI